MYTHVPVLEDPVLWILEKTLEFFVLLACICSLQTIVTGDKVTRRTTSRLMNKGMNKGMLKPQSSCAELPLDLFRLLLYRNIYTSSMSTI